ncbi:carbohydrate kinase family protein [Candidatus Nomurabacteria bacterium]|nr:carbohydrate kinase family protein [Candidatus Nomurabacteria bacterium]
MNYDFIAIGDIVTDAFIRLQDAEIHCDIKHEDCQICLRFGDKVPYESVTVVPAVGNSPNAATSAARLGLKSAIITNLGDDQNGTEAIETLDKNGVETVFVTKHRGQKTNYHYVLWYQDDRTILIRHEEYAYALPEFTTKWVYLSSLGENSLPFHSKIAEHLAQHPEIKLAFQPGTFQIKLGYEKLKNLYEHTEIFFCNVDEARRILNRKDSNEEKEAEIKNLLREISSLGPKIVVITDGKDGAYASDGNNTWFMKPYPDPKPPLERTGAGDSFASTVVSALALGKSLPEALRWGPINSMSVVQQIGAQAGLLTREKLEEYLKNAPADYSPKMI